MLFSIHFLPFFVRLNFRFRIFWFVSWSLKQMDLCIGHEILGKALKLTWKWLDLCSHQPSFNFFFRCFLVFLSPAAHLKSLWVDIKNYLSTRVYVYPWWEHSGVEDDTDATYQNNANAVHQPPLKYIEMSILSISLSSIRKEVFSFVRGS